MTSSPTPPPNSPISMGRVSTRRLLFVSGQIALDAAGAVAHPGDAEAQADMAFAQISTILDEHGSTFADVVKLTTYIVDSRHLDAVRSARARVFSGPYPAATSVVVAGLARAGLLVEIEAIAEVPDELPSKIEDRP